MVDIVESTPRRLVLRRSDRETRLFLLGGLGASLVWCLVAYGTVRTTSVRCARGPAGLTCDLTERLLGIIPLESQRVEHVEGAFVEEIDSNGSDGTSRAYGFALKTEGDHDTRRSSITTSEWQCDFFVWRFNDFVRSADGAAGFVLLPDLWLIIVFLPLGALALIGFVLAQPYSLEIDRDLACLNIRDGFFKRVSHPLADVDDVRVEKREDDGRTISEVFLLLKGGRRLRLAIAPEVVDLVGDYVPRRVS